MFVCFRESSLAVSRPLSLGTSAPAKALAWDLTQAGVSPGLGEKASAHSSKSPPDSTTAPKSPFFPTYLVYSLEAAGHLLKLLSVLAGSTPKHLAKSEENNLGCLKIGMEH